MAMSSGNPMDLSEDRSGSVVASTAAGFTIATIALATRLIARYIANKRLELNDFFMIAAYVPKLGIDIASVFLLHYGIGKHVMALTESQLVNYLKTEYVGSFLYAPCIGFIKLSILSLYAAAFPAAWVKRCVWVTATIVTAWAIACCLVGLMACLPIHKVWDLTGTVEGHCIDLHKYYYGLQIPNIVTDVIILAMPWPAVLALRMSRRETIMMLSVLMIGILTLVFDIIRLVVLVQTPNTADFSWNQVGASVWTDLEPSVAMLAACMPLWRPLFHPIAMYRKSRAPNESGIDSTISAEEETELTFTGADKMQYESYNRDLSTRSSNQYHPY